MNYDGRLGDVFGNARVQFGLSFFRFFCNGGERLENRSKIWNAISKNNRKSI